MLQERKEERQLHILIKVSAIQKRWLFTKKSLTAQTISLFLPHVLYHAVLPLKIWLLNVVKRSHKHHSYSCLVSWILHRLNYFPFLFSSFTLISTKKSVVAKCACVSFERKKKMLWKTFHLSMHRFGGIYASLQIIGSIKDSSFHYNKKRDLRSIEVPFRMEEIFARLCEECNFWNSGFTNQLDP